MDNLTGIEGVILTPLKILLQDNGSVMHCIKSSDETFTTMGEVYYSTVQKGCIKGWKRHNRMTLNLVVPVGCVKFVMFDSRKDSHTYDKFWEVKLSKENYQRLTVPPGIWVAFQGIYSDINLLTNVASIEHDPKEADKCDIDDIKYKWK